MTAFIDRDRLLRHALPGALSEILRLADPRPVLMERWQIYPDDRPACRWAFASQADASGDDPPGWPPH